MTLSRKPKPKSIVTPPMPDAGPIVPTVDTGTLPSALAPQHVDHPHQNLDRSARAAVARLSGGVSLHAFLQAWTDWAFHFSHSPGRQMELFERAQVNALKLPAYAASTDATTPPPFEPKSFDHRFEHPAWQQFPFRAWQQGFLALQDWWDHATDTLRGLEQQDADRTRYMARQAPDLISPSNFPVTNPEILAATAREGGRNLIEGAVHLAQDFIQTATQRRDPRPKDTIWARNSPVRPAKWCFATICSN